MFRLIPSDERVAAMLCLGVLCAALPGIGWSPVADPPAPGGRPAQTVMGDQIDLNSASVTELTQLRGVGPMRAADIVADRQSHGPFHSVDDLQRVHGVGPKTVDRNRRWLKIRPTTSSDATVD